MRVWMNGAFVPLADAVIGVRDRGFLLGDGLFETLLWVDGRLVDFSAHFERMRDGASYLRLKIPASSEAIEAACRETASTNSGPTGRAAVRITLSRGEGARGLSPPEDAAPLLLVVANPVGEAPFDPVDASIVSIQRHPGAPSARFKTLSYVDNIAALQEARGGGFDEALLLNPRGGLACASAANLFTLSDNVMATPRVEDGAMPGVVRRRLLEIARGMGVETRETQLTPEEARAAFCFLTNSLIGLRPIASIDGAPGRAPPPVFEELVMKYAAHVSAPEGAVHS
ncbi:MAG: aminotransferase class IV [Pseudomonadota bacterium]